MIANRDVLNLHILITAFIVLVNQQILFSSAQQNSPIDNSSPEQSVTTKLMHLGPEGKSMGFSEAIDIRQPLTNATSISCYECNSYVDPDCKDKPQKFEKNCTNSFKGSAYIGCRKIDQWVDYNGGDGLEKHHRVIRQCAADGDISKPCYYRAGYGGRINACFCDSNLCNSGHLLNAFNFQFLFVMSISLFLVISFS